MNHVKALQFRRTTIPASLALMLVMLTFFAVVPAVASQFSLEEGATLFYKWMRVGSGTGGVETGDAAFEILVANQTMMVTRATGTVSVCLTVKYSDGFPTYAERLEALIYLPQKCIAQTLKGSLDWAKHVETQTASVADAVAQQQEFTVEAGTFQSLNITLSLVGWMYGNLTLMYDVNSGILIYERWVPEYGDIITQSLTAVTHAAKPQNLAFSILLTAATFATPAAVMAREARTFKKRRFESAQTPTEKAASGVFSRKILCLILIGALLNLVSTLLPWSQLGKTAMYLPFSLPTALTAPTTLIPVAVSLTAHSAAILVWVGVAAALYTHRKVLPQLAMLVSSILSFASAVMLLQSGWTPFLGVVVIAAAASLTILGLTAANVKMEILIEGADKEDRLLND